MKLRGIILTLYFVAWALKIDENRTVSRIAFGSCANQFGQDNPELYDSISDLKSDIFI